MMGIRLSRVYIFSVYEIRRALARRKVLAMVAFTAILDIVPYYVLSSTGTTIIPASLFPYLWVAGVFAPFALFIQFIAILIAAGAMAEEYEQGTAELLLSKPVSRTEFFVGKFVGGYLLLVFLITLSAGLSVLAATLTFGPQAGLGILPGVIAVEAYSSTLFFSVAFMLGELVRRSSLAYILSSAVIVTSQIIGFYLTFAYELTGKAFYQTIHVYLPTTIAGSLPPQYAQPLLPTETRRVFELVLGPGGGTPTEVVAIGLIGIYFLAAFAVALGYFRHVDVARKVS